MSTLGGPRLHGERLVRRRVGWLAVALTALGIAVHLPGQYLVTGLHAAAAAGTGLASTSADAPWFIRVAFYLHITTAGVALLVGRSSSTR